MRVNLNLNFFPIMDYQAINFFLVVNQQNNAKIENFFFLQNFERVPELRFKSLHLNPLTKYLNYQKNLLQPSTRLPAMTEETIGS